LRLLLVDADTQGIERIKRGENIQGVRLDDRDIGPLESTHRGCLEAESPAGSHLVAQVRNIIVITYLIKIFKIYLDAGESVAPAKDYDVVLKGRHGTGEVTIKWWNRIIDALLFPLLFIKGQYGYGNICCNYLFVILFLT
jgi:hypothetical protein